MLWLVGNYDELIFQDIQTQQINWVEKEVIM